MPRVKKGRAEAIRLREEMEQERESEMEQRLAELWEELAELEEIIDDNPELEYEYRDKQEQCRILYNGLTHQDEDFDTMSMEYYRKSQKKSKKL